MKLKLNFIIYTFFISYMKLCHSESEDVRNYLNNHLIRVKTELNKNVLKRETEVDIIVNTFQIKSTFLNHTSVSLFELFHKTYAVIDGALYNITQVDSTLKLIHSKEFIETDAKQHLQFIRSFTFFDMGFVFVSFSTGNSHIYGCIENENEFFYIQSIQNTGRAIDCKFFINQNQLYLAIVNNFENSSPFLIYKWSNTYFDETVELQLSNPGRIVSFSHGNTEIIILSQNDSKASLIVNEFKDDHLIKTQLLEAENLDEILTLAYKNQKYLLVFQNKQTCLFYQWKGDEFTFEKQFPCNEIEKIAAFSFNNIPVICSLKKNNTLLIDSISNYKLQTIYQIKLGEEFKQILDMKVLPDMKHILLFYISPNNTLSYAYSSLQLTLKDIEKGQRDEREDLLNCMRNLKIKLEINKDKLQDLEKQQKKFLLTNKPLNNSEKLVAESLQADTLNISSQTILSKSQYDAVGLKRNLNDLITRFNLVKSKDLIRYANPIQLKKMVVNGSLNADQVVAQNLNIKYLNSKRWNSKIFLSCTKPQTITGFFTIDTLYIRNLIHKHFNETSFKLENPYLQSTSVRQSENIPISESEADPESNQGSGALKHIGKIKSGQFQFSSNMKIANFNFETINGIEWNSFKNSVFRFSETSQINGNIYFTNGFNSNNLRVTSLSGIDVNEIVTTVTDQNITSKFKFGAVIASNVIYNVINGMNLETEAVTTRNTYIKGPVSINNLNVTKQLIMNVSNLDEHIIGTQESDLAQIYNKKVKILGRLIVTNLTIPQLTTTLINGQEFSGKVLNSYWLKSTNQVVPVHFEALEGVSTTYLGCKELNNVEVANYMLNNVEEAASTNLVFKNITVLGNIIIAPTLSHTPDLITLEKEAVRTSGSYNIKGQIILQGTLEVGNLITNYLDEKLIASTLNLINANIITGTKKFENLIIQGDLRAGRIIAHNLNNVYLKSLEERVVFIDKPEEISSLRFQSVSVKNLFTSNMNEVHLQNHLLFLNSVFSLTSLNNLFVNGDVWMGNIQNLVEINNYDMNTLRVNALVYGNDVIFENNIIFNANMFIENLHVINVNNVNLQELFSRLLYKNWNQNISFPYTFDKINTGNLYVPQINDIPTRFLVNTKNSDVQQLLLGGKLQINYSKFLKSLTAETLSTDLDFIVSNLKNPSPRYWNTINVAHNVSVWDVNSDLDVIFKNVINRKSDNIVTGKVTFNGDVFSNVVRSDSLINNVNLTTLFNDALVKDTTEQTIFGKKYFKQLAISRGLIAKNANIPIVNDIDIINLNESIIFKDNIYNVAIKGLKIFFDGFQATRLWTDAISGISTENFVNLANLKVIPKSYFHFLKVINNFNVEFCNYINVSYILTNRLLRNTKQEQIAWGIYYFDNLILKGDVYTSYINNVILEDAVFDYGTQYILGTKSFEKDLIINGNIAIKFLNNVDISERYKQSILHGKTNLIKGTTIFHNTTSIQTNIATDFINGLPINNFKSFIERQAPIIKTDTIYETLNSIKSIINASSAITKKTFHKYLYLEKSDDFQINIPNVSEVDVIKTQNGIMLYVTRHESGLNYGLKKECHYPLQDTVQVSSEYSVNFAAEVGMKRAFSYEDKELSIHLFTNSIIHNENCGINRTLDPDETTSLMLMIHSRNRSKSFFYPNLLSSYVSDVKYFRNRNLVYMIISRYYDSTNDTYNLNCQVYKILNTEGKVELIQNIETSKVWKLNIFSTFHGTILILNKVSSPEKISHVLGAEIYKFDEDSEQFGLLRKIEKSAYSITVGIPINTGSVIIIAQKEVSSLEVYKFNPLYKNYYFHRYIYLDSPATSISFGYNEEYENKEIYLYVVTKNHMYYIYTYHYIEEWKQVSKGEIDKLKSIVPFTLNRKQFLLFISTKSTSVINIIQQGLN